VAIATVELLERAGFKVFVPMQPLCCGRPLYDFGMLERAKSWLRTILTNLQPYIERGVPMIVLEPSCMAVFKDELINFFPQDPDAQRLCNQTFLLSEFISQHKERFNLPKLNRKALMQVHCHQKSVKGETPEEDVMKSLGLEIDIPEPGCCGMAGAFGFESKHASLAAQIGGTHLIPAVRAANKETLIIADGFSCKQQIFQSTDREALHLAEVIQLAYLDASNSSPEPYPERKVLLPSKFSPTAPEIGLFIIAVCAILFLAITAMRA
jgi:Fe-S oxidoreductase